MRSSTFIFLSLLPGGDSYRTSVDDAANLDADLDEEFGFRCPHGLTANATDETCSYYGEMFDDPDEHSTLAWADGSKYPIVFNDWGGLQNAELELIRELEFVLTNPAFVHEVVHNSMEHHHQHQASTLHSIVESVEAQSEDLAAVEFIAEHAVEHLVIEGLAFGLSTLAGAAGHGALAAVATVFEGAAIGLEHLGFVLGHPVILGISAVHTAFQLRAHWHTKDARARSFTVGLVSKSDCIANRVALHREDLLDDHDDLRDSTFFIPEVEAVCGRATETQLVQQMIKTNAAMLDLFNEFKGIGKCVYPEGPRAWSKSNCIHAIYEPLRSNDGAPGILYSAFGLAAAYGQESDEILGKPIYSEWFERYFNITLPHAEDAQQELRRVADNAAATMQDKATACVSLIGLHRAFERVFVRLKTALQVFMHTFARSKVHYSTRTIQHPCRRVFREFEEREQGLCKDGSDLPVMVPDTEWLEEHAQHLSDSMLSNIGSCLEDSHPELALSLSLSSSGPEEGENEEEEHGSSDEE